MIEMKNWQRGRYKLPRWFAKVCIAWWQKTQQTDEPIVGWKAINEVLHHKDWGQVFGNIGKLGSGDEAIMYSMVSSGSYEIANDMAHQLGIELVSNPGDVGPVEKNIYQFALGRKN
jgi:hypothetical protein